MNQYIIGVVGVITSNQTLKMYQILSEVFLISSIVLFIVMVIIWLIFDVKHALIILTGFGAKKEIEKLHSEAAQKNLHSTRSFGSKKGVISWVMSTSKTNESTFGSDIKNGNNIQSSQDYTVVLQAENATSDETIVLDEYLDDINSTVVLNSVSNTSIDKSQRSKTEKTSRFVIEKDIVNTASDTELS